jgi:penicillin-binding protein 2
VRQGWRLAAVGGFLATLLAILVLRMWFLQVASLDESLVVAENQQIKVVTIEAPRGDIFGAGGREIMAGTTAELRVVVDRALIPAERLEPLIQNLSALLGMPVSEVRQVFDDNGSGTRFAIGDAISASTGVFVLESIEDFPGVVVEPRPVRVYPLGTTAGHIVGYIGAPGPEDLDRVDITPRDKVGKFGVERTYDRLLRGTPGTITYRVNATGEILGIVEEVPPKPGGSVITTIDLELQRFVERSLESAYRLAKKGGAPVRRASAIVLDPNSGSVLAMANFESFDPTVFADGSISQEEWEALEEKAVLNNFTIQGLYPPGSSFKVIPYSLALEEGIFPSLEDEEDAGRVDSRDPSAFFCDGQLLFPNTPPLNDWLAEGHGAINITSSLQQSCNLYYWSIALEIWNGRGVGWEEDLLQDWARTLGFGSRTGIDLPFEQAGLVPDREWFQFHQQNNTGVVRSEGGWAGGDVMNIATGQGALVVTPIQMANAYATLLNGGTLWQPRVVDTVVDSENNVIFTNLPSANASIPLDGSTVLRLRNDLNLVVNSPLGTARVAFEGFCDDEPDSACAALQEVGGKTGTAEIFQALTEEEGVQEIDTAWFVGAAPLSDPQWIVAVVVDQGGSGGAIAAPTARRILQFLMGEEPDPIITGQEAE